ncbi:hypothetical protein Aperf_G00000066616 [Anoplocephala perfoliata]
MMALTCGEQCLRILLIVCNLLVFLFGCVCTGFASYSLAKIREYTDDPRAIATIATILTLVLITLLLGFLGCCGAWKLDTCLLKTYAVVISILLVIEVICGILVLVYHDKVRDYSAQYLRHLIDAVESSGSSEQEEAIIRNIQEKLKCCGASGPSDWKDKGKYCCPRGDIACQLTASFGQGCVEVIYNYIRNHAMVVGIVAIVLAIVEIGAVFSACCLAGKQSV